MKKESDPNLKKSLSKRSNRLKLIELGYQMEDSFDAEERDELKDKVGQINGLGIEVIDSRE